MSLQERIRSIISDHAENIESFLETREQQKGVVEPTYNKISRNPVWGERSQSGLYLLERRNNPYAVAAMGYELDQSLHSSESNPLVENHSEGGFDLPLYVLQVQDHVIRIRYGEREQISDAADAFEVTRNTDKYHKPSGIELQHYGLLQRDLEEGYTDEHSKKTHFSTGPGSKAVKKNLST